MAIIVLVVSISGKALAATSVNLDTANGFAVLGGTTVTNTGYSVVNGDLGLSPGASTLVTGFPPGIVNGTIHVTDDTAASAQTSLTTAYNDATGQSCDTDLTGQDLGNLTLTPGVYCFSTSAQLTGALTLDAQGDPSAVFIFKTGSTLITASDSSVNLINSAQSCNVFWRVGSSATLGSSTIFTGNIIALTSITINISATVDGRVLARNGEVILNSNTITAAVCATPLINIIKVPNPLSLPGGPGSVTYNYTVTNPGVVAMSNITVTDDTCSPVSYISGDTDADNRLDTTETWSYGCTMTLSTTTTNTVTATGLANGFTATDTANATVVVDSAIVPPLINIVKTPNTFIVSSGGTVIYTYEVTNPGTVALSDVSVTDDKCAPLSSPSGDSNTNNLLDVSETWVYTCQMTLTATTTNIATAVGSANSLTATDTSTATVVVTPPVIPPVEPTVVTIPKLPNTGISPQQNVGLGVVLAGIITVLFSLYFVRKRLKNKP